MRAYAEFAAAVKAVRRRFGDSQQQFAQRLGVAIRSVAHYENDRRPRGQTLYRLAQLASEVGLSQEEELFRTAFRREVGALAAAVLDPDLVPCSPTEKVFVGALLMILRKPKYIALRSKLKADLDHAVRDYLADGNAARGRQMEKIERLLDQGKTPAEIAQEAEAQVEAARLLKAWRSSAE